MTKAHFLAIAQAIAGIENPHARYAAASALAVVCLRFNPHFDTGAFLLACDVVAVPAEVV